MQYPILSHILNKKLYIINNKTNISLVHFIIKVNINLIIFFTIRNKA